MRVGLDRAEIVERDDLNVLAAGLGDGAQDVAADAAKPVNGNPDGHSIDSFEIFVMRGHSPSKTGVNALMPAHPSFLRNRWIAGSSPAMTPVFQARLLAQVPSLLNAASATFSGVMPKCR